MTALDDPDNRYRLLDKLPLEAVATIRRNSAKGTDLYNIVQAAEGWGQLTSGEWALVVIAQNALSLVKGTHPGRQLEALLAERVIHQAKPGRQIPLDLPAREENFIDRKDELVSLLTELQPGRVVTLTGPGGMGKTALAAEAVGQLVVDHKPPERFPDGIFFHSFYNQPQAGLALESLALAFGEEARPTAQVAAQRALSGRQALLVLDGAEDADDLAAVLAVRGGCGVLITSRNRGDAPAVLQDLAPLKQQDALDLLQRWAEAQLDDQAAAIAICELVGRLPLAVRLVGRYLRETGETASEYLAWLQETPLEALNQGRRREESIPVLLERSLKQVSEAARQVLAVAGRLALAPLQQEVMGAALAAEAREVRQWLGELVRYGLLSRDKGRYAISHALIHTYASERLNVAEEMVERLVAFYVALAEHFSQQGLAGYQALDGERPHLLRLIAGCAKGDDWLGVRKLVWAIDGYLSIQGHASERQTALATGLTAAQQLGDRQDEGAFLGSLGTAYYDQGELDKAIAHSQQALVIHREIGYRQGEAYNLGILGLAYRAQGERAKAREYLAQALTIFEAIKSPQADAIREQLTMLTMLGRLHILLAMCQAIYEKGLMRQLLPLFKRLIH